LHTSFAVLQSCIVKRIKLLCLLIFQILEDETKFIAGKASAFEILLAATAMTYYITKMWQETLFLMFQTWKQEYKENERMELQYVK